MGRRERTTPAHCATPATGGLRRAEDGHRRSEVLLGLADEPMRFDEKAEARGFCRDLVRGHPVQMHRDVTGFGALAWLDDLAAPVQCGASALIHHAEQLGDV